MKFSRKSIINILSAILAFGGAFFAAYQTRSLISVAYIIVAALYSFVVYNPNLIVKSMYLGPHPKPKAPYFFIENKYARNALIVVLGVFGLALSMLYPLKNSVLYFLIIYVCGVRYVTILKDAVAEMRNREKVLG